MASNKVSISIPSALADFVDMYRRRQGYRTRSRVFEDALKLLREKDLEAAYRAASAEIDDEWESTAGDGLEDETW
jgi:metal-responsive CopG/Arc/MetJ family transcriptional regulator